MLTLNPPLRVDSVIGVDDERVSKQSNVSQGQADRAGEEVSGKKLSVALALGHCPLSPPGTKSG